jgi:hypothetical protein
MNDVRFSVTNYPQINYLIEQGKFDNLTAIDDQGEINFEPKSFQLYQNYPNPFNPTTKIKFSIPPSPVTGEGRGEVVTLKIYDLLGRKVAALVNEKLSSGTYEVEFDGSNCPSGIYFYKLETESFYQTKRMVLIK